MAATAVSEFNRLSRLIVSWTRRHTYLARLHKLSVTLFHKGMLAKTSELTNDWTWVGNDSESEAFANVPYVNSHLK